MSDLIKWSIDGCHDVAALEGGEAKLLVDPLIPTNIQHKERDPDLMLYLKRQQCVVFMEAAVTWELLLKKKECRKF